MAGLDKRVATYEQALEGLTDNMTVLAGGFGLCGIPVIDRIEGGRLAGLACNCAAEDDRPNAHTAPRPR